MSGDEPVFNPDLWDTPTGIGSANCFSYAMDDYDSTRTQKAMPGERAGQTSQIDYTKCGKLRRRLLADNPHGIYAVRPTTRCQEGFFKLMMFTDSTGGPDGVGDFHFYKQHRDVLYKAGAGETADTIAKFFKVHKNTMQNMTTGVLAGVKKGDMIMIPNANVWSHKLGVATGALLKDSCGRLIKDPRTACRKYSFNYDNFCGAYCARKNKVHTR